jgi:hypothetical protein
VYNAIQTWKEIYRTNQERRKEKGKEFQDQTGSPGLGSRDVEDRLY